MMLDLLRRIWGWLMNNIFPNRRRRRVPLRYVLQSLGLTTNLKLCLDAGDAASYPGSGTKWLDTSGGGYDFNFGNGATSSTYPTFNGSAGGLSSSEYFSFDGGDYFTYDTTNEAWMNNLHKDGAVFWFSGWLYVPSLPGSAAVLFGTANSGLDVGVYSFVRTTGALRLVVVNGTESILLVTSTAAVTTGAWNFLALQVNESAGTGFFQVNAAQEDFVSTYASPSSSNASFTMEIGRHGTDGSGIPLPSGYRFNSIAMSESTAPSKAQTLALYTATKARFGL